MKKISIILTCSLLAFNMVACSTQLETESPEASVDVSVDDTTEITTEVEEVEEVEETEEDVETSLVDELTLYITLDGGLSYEEVPFTSDEPLSAELLISELATETGWNLDLADEVTSGKGGMTVSFANTSALFVGPPDPQMDAYFVFDSNQLTSAILDSITYTLQQNFVDTSLGGDPSSLDIYYCGEGDAELYFENTGGYVSLYEPYTSISYEER
ncbi:MAG: hypothetical protein R3Y47_05910 [Lachnospiraceae bacterium]